MTIQEAIARSAQNEQERNLGRRIADLYAIAERSGRPMHTGFLSLSEQAFCRDMAQKSGMNLTFFGGYSGAERCVGTVEPADAFWKDTSYISVLRFSFSEPLSHRDILGAAMGLSLKRDTIGDILLEDHTATVLVLSKMADFLQQNLIKAGRANLQGEMISLEEVHAVTPKTEEVKDTVASLRIDCIIASAFCLSRELAKQAIQREFAQINYRTVTSVSREVKEGDVLSVRGYGKCVLEAIGGESRKGRLFVRIQKYI